MISISTLGMTRAEWLNARRMGIGGSDAAAIVGLNQYITSYALWADKTGRLPEQEENEAMRQGRELEDYVAKRFAEQTGLKVRRRNQIIKNDAYPFALANIDRDVVGERAGLECKTTTSLNMKRFRNGDFPAHYYVQCVHYLAVTGYDRWYLAVLIFGTDLKIFTIERDEDEIKALMDAERSFWETYVVPDVPPPVDGFAPTDRAIDALFPSESAQAGETVQLFLSDQLRNYMELKQQAKAIDELLKKTEQQIKTELGDATEGTCDGFKITWKPQTRQTFDWRKFTEDRPTIDLSEYFKTSGYRRFTIKEDKR